MKKDKNGLYRTKVVVGHNADGDPVVKWISGRTKRELEEARQRVTAKYITGEATGGDMLFGVYASKWYRVRKRPYIKDATARRYEWIFNSEILPVFGDRQISAISPIELQEFMNKFSGKSRGLLDFLKTIFNSVFRSAVVDRYIPYNPADALVEPTAAIKKERRALTDAERERILVTIDRHPHAMLLAVLYYTGMRPGEAWGLKWGDIDFVNNSIHIQRDISFLPGGAREDTLKNRTSDRVIPMPSGLRECLLKARSLPHLYLFGDANNEPQTYIYLRRMWFETMIDAGLAELIDPNGIDIFRQYRPVITPHCLRHNYMSMMHAAGVDPYTTARLAGHSSIRTTMDIYTHLDDQAKTAMAADVESVFNKSCTKVAVNNDPKR